MIKIINFIKKHYFILLLILFVLLLRLPLFYYSTFPFGFDHGKDSLATLDMIVNLSPKFVGPWTSIPGLYFGAAWYYLLAPGYFLLSGNPIAGVITMLILLFIQMVIAYKYFGRIEAIIIATGATWYTISTSAWNPFPMTLVSLVILTIISRLKKNDILTKTKSFSLGFLAAMGFHFSTAFAIFFVPLILLSLIYRKIKLSLSVVMFGIIGVIIPFIPQALFEIKNGFMQIKAVLAYLNGGESDPISLSKIKLVITTTYNELLLAVSPQIWSPDDSLNQFLKILGVILIWLAVITAIRKRKTDEYSLWFETISWLIIPIVAFSFLHFNFWYLLPMTPIVTLLVGHSVRVSPNYIKHTFIFLMILTALSFSYRFFYLDKESFLVNSSFIPVKTQVINEIRNQSDGKPFASYHYVSDIYDYSYQYIYFWQAQNGQKMPTEFSYKPGESIYIVQKPALLDAFSEMQVNSDPELIFYVVEGSGESEFLDSWWNHQEYKEIILEKKISDSITLYTALPK